MTSRTGIESGITHMLEMGEPCVAIDPRLGLGLVPEPPGPMADPFQRITGLQAPN
jgi:hypothetical protein